MELNEFTSIWKKNIQKGNAASLDKEELNAMIQSASEKILAINKANKIWWIITIVGILFLALVTVATGVLYFVLPERLSSLQQAMPAIIIIVAFATTTFWLYRMKSKLFEIDYNSNLKLAIHKSVKKFFNWYRLSVYTNIVMLIPLYYLLITGVCYKFQLQVPLYLQILFSILCMAITLLLNHKHYKKNYFDLIARLKQNLTELEMIDKHV